MPVLRSRRSILLACAVIGGALFWAGEKALAASPSQAPSPEPAASDAAKTVELAVPLKDGGFLLGDVAVRLATDNSLFVNRAQLLAATGRILRPEALAALEAKLAKAEYIALAQIGAAGLPCSYDPEKLDLTAAPTPEQRPRGTVSGTLAASAVPADNLAKPAAVSGYVNLFATAGYDRQSGSAGQYDVPEAVLEGAVRLSGVVLEAEADLHMDGTAAPKGARLIYDRPDDALRFTAGDIQPAGFGVAAPSLYGISIEKSYHKLQPTRSIRPTGRRSFRLERGATVDVLINGRPLRRLNLGPGEYDLDDLPLTAGSNAIKLLIKDETGREETLDFDILFDRSLLQPGLSEWQVAAGLPADSPPELSEADAAPYVSAGYRRGLTESLTGALRAEGDEASVNNGLAALMQTPAGLLQLEATGSLSAGGGVGWALAANFDLAPALLEWSDSAALRLGLDLASAEFTLPGASGTGSPERLRVTGAYSRDLTAGVTGTISGSYTIEAENETPYTLGASVSRSFGGGLSMSLSGSYGSDAAPSQDDRAAFDLSGLSVFGRLNYRLGAASNVNLGYDVGAARATTRVGTREGSGAGSWSAELEFVRTAPDDERPVENALEASLGYTGNRFEVSASHGREFHRLNGVRHIHNGVTFGTSVAFADGLVAMGRPVRGSFALVETHPSLKEHTLRVSPAEDQEAARSDLLGAALVSDLSAYASTRLPYDVEDLPLGYDLGNGAFDLLAPYKAGYRLSVGAGFGATVTGSLRNEEGQALSLRAGQAFDEKNPARKIDLFTNEAGRFGAQGLGGGNWIIEVADPPLRYKLALPENAAGLLDIGALDPLP